MALRSTASDGQEEEGEGGRELVPATALVLGTCAGHGGGGDRIALSYTQRVMGDTRSKPSTPIWLSPPTDLGCGV